MERYNKLIDKLVFSFSFIDCLYFKCRLENLKNEFFITNISVIYFSAADCPFQVNDVDYICDYLLRMQMILFRQLNIIFLTYL